MSQTKSFIEKDNVGSQDQEETPIAVRPKGFVPPIVENFEKAIQNNPTWEHVNNLGNTNFHDFILVFNLKLLADEVQKQSKKIKESQHKFFEAMINMVELMGRQVIA